jgi:hypothetical protein
MPVMRIATLCALVAGLGSGCASAKTEEAPRPAQEIVSGGARIRGGGVRMDVQVGRTLTPRPVRAPGVTAKPAAVVTP